MMVNNITDLLGKNTDVEDDHAYHHDHCGCNPDIHHHHNYTNYN